MYTKAFRTNATAFTRKGHAKKELGREFIRALIPRYLLHFVLSDLVSERASFTAFSKFNKGGLALFRLELLGKDLRI